LKSKSLSGDTSWFASIFQIRVSWAR